MTVTRYSREDDKLKIAWHDVGTPNFLLELEGQ
jgi:hypothetical protein